MIAAEVTDEIATPVRRRVRLCVVLLDAHMPGRLEEMLRSHPATARTVIVRLPIAASQSVARDRR
jgi:hypothetical protein